MFSSVRVERRKGDCSACGSGLCPGEVGRPISIPEEGRVVAGEVEMYWIAPRGRVKRVIRSKDYVVHPEILVRGYRHPCGDQVERPIMIAEGGCEDPILACRCGGEVGQLGSPV